jgi:2-phospho-L-lactate/phosphoenolpyruvate guanylyltransferase
MDAHSGPLQVIFAARGGRDAKSRCAAALSPDAREALAECLLRDVLDAAQELDTWLVTPTPRLAEIAGGAGAHVILERDGEGLNGAYAQALAHVSDDAPRALMPSDLAYLSAADFKAGSAALCEADIAIAPTQHSGTGAIFLRAGIAFTPMFGPNSFERHVEQARAAGLRLVVLETPGLTRDIDWVEDLTALALERPHSHTGMFAKAWLASAATPAR